MSFSYLQLKDIRNALTYIYKALRVFPDDEMARNFLKEMIKEYKKVNKFDQEFNAIRDMEFNESGRFGTLEYEDNGITSLDQIDSLELTRFIAYRLRLNDNSIEDISIFDGFTGLYYLELKNNNVSSIASFRNLPSLKELKLANNKLESLEGIENLPNLTVLDISGNQIDEMSLLLNQTNLRALDLNDNNLKKIEGIEKSVKIYNLDLADNQIEKIEGLDNLGNLQNLDLSNNRIKKIEGIIIKPKLSFVNLSDNQICETDGLKHFTEVKSLNLSNNQITSLKDFTQMRNLKYLNLSGNKLETIDNLENLTNLSSLNLENNPNLPDFFAVKYKDVKAISNLRKYSGKSNEQLQEVDRKEKERLAEEKIQRKERYVKQREDRKRMREQGGFVTDTDVTSRYGLDHDLQERFVAILKIDEPGRCLYCKAKLLDKVSYAKHCGFAIADLIDETQKKLPTSAKDKDNYTERKVTEQVTNRRLDAWDRPGYTTVTRTIKHYSSMFVGRFEQQKFPRLQGYLCEDCGREFIRKTRRHFKHLQRRWLKKDHFAHRIQRAMKRCHENYMKAFESMLEKRGF
ncbi:MAG: hypothetical protein GPJ52_06585 [Candidatus Heimdallarchaeota archaeon]|nr:hypothetical protein [Candidatus Heimdallarchaeota archaeon]MCG3253886.1 leucine-rich repeat domain-containing protein [Candidatus Heimdallarchaeota archaeon]MCK4291019.1 leucine-rich repeat domain-containing protein [Candidatus Heimdallarchaeota archaeon]